MANYEDSNSSAEPQQYKPILVLRMLCVPNQERVVVQEHGLCFLESNTVFAGVLGSLPRIPEKPQLAQIESLTTL